jgi:hypothetical protein
VCNVLHYMRSINDHHWRLFAFACRSVTEVAGLWPGPKVLHYARQHARAQWVTRLFGDCVLSVSGEAGLMLPWGEKWRTTSTCVCDRCPTAHCPCLIISTLAGLGERPSASVKLFSSSSLLSIRSPRQC